MAQSDQKNQPQLYIRNLHSLALILLPNDNVIVGFDFALIYQIKFEHNTYEYF
jgi:hypothetical protein